MDEKSRCWRLVGRWAGVLGAATLVTACGHEAGGDGDVPGHGLAANQGGYGPVTTCSGPGARYVTGVVSAQYGPGQDHGQDQMPAVVLGPPRGAGCCSGSLDVVSLGNGGEIVVAFAGNAIVDGPGVDFIVFENAFHVGGNPESLFVELATVEVSEDGVHWVGFPCTAEGPPFGSCAGWHPVYQDGEGTEAPPDPDVAGGDGFDLAAIGVAAASFVRIVDRPDLDGPMGVFDLDAVGIVHALCP